MKAVVREKKIPFEIRVDSSEDIGLKALDAFNLMRESTAGREDISLDQINAEIKCVRDEKK